MGQAVEPVVKAAPRDKRFKDSEWDENVVFDYIKQSYLLTSKWINTAVHTTEDFGRIVFELVERGEMKKTDQDSLDDFCDIYKFDEVFDEQYIVDVSRAFSA